VDAKRRGIEAIGIKRAGPQAFQPGALDGVQARAGAQAKQGAADIVGGMPMLQQQARGQARGNQKPGACASSTAQTSGGLSGAEAGTCGRKTVMSGSSEKCSKCGMGAF